MNNYLFFIGILLIALWLFVRFKFQNNYKIGSDNFKRTRSLSYIFLGIGIICICFYFILDPYNTFPQLKGWSKVLLAGTIYVYICFVVPHLIQRKINKIYKKKRKFGFGFDAPKEHFKNIYIGLISGVPIVISILYLIFSYLKIFPEFTYGTNQLLDAAFNSDNNFIFLIYGFIFVPVIATFFYGAGAAFFFLSALYVTLCGFFWEKGIKESSGLIKIIFIIAAVVIYFIIYNSILGDYLSAE
jgi:hypothetical protein